MLRQEMAGHREVFMAFSVKDFNLLFEISLKVHDTLSLYVPPDCLVTGSFGATGDSI